jgi:hypothetical protein
LLLCLLLALVPAGILYVITLATPMNLFIPRYCLVAVPGSALTWGFLTSRIDSRLLRSVFCVGLVAATIFILFATPVTRNHEVNFKRAFEAANANLETDKSPVLICSAFIESDYESMPAPATENALFSQTSYYKINAPTVLLPLDLNNETRRVAGQTVQDAAQQHKKVLMVAGPQSFPTVEWIANYTSGIFSTRLIGEFDQIMVVEFAPIAEESKNRQP